MFQNYLQINLQPWRQPAPFPVWALLENQVQAWSPWGSRTLSPGLRLNLSQQVIVNQTDKKLKCFSPSEKPQSCKPVIPKAGRYRTSPDQTPQLTSDSGTACADNIWEACEKETAYKVSLSNS